MHHVAGVVEFDLAAVAEGAFALGELPGRILHARDHLRLLSRDQQHGRGDSPPARYRLLDPEQVRIDDLVPRIAREHDLPGVEPRRPVAGEESGAFLG